MATITRFAPGGVLTDVGVNAASVAEASNRGYPASLSYMGLGKVKEFELTFSPATVTSGPGQRSVTTIAVGDYVKLFTIPANHVLVAARLEVLTAGTGTGTLAMNDGAALGSAQAVASVGQQVYATNKVYTVDTDLQLLSAVAAVTDGLYRVVAVTIDMTGQDTTRLITG